MTTTPQTLTTDDCEKLLAALLNRRGYQATKEKAVRNYCMALLMLDAGLRVGEVVQLRSRHLYFNCQPVSSIIIAAEIAKNKTERRVPFSQRLFEALNNHAQVNGAFDNLFNDKFVFYKRPNYEPLTTRQVERIVRKAAISSLGRPIHPHVLRHTFASRLMRTTNARIVQELLGHKHLSSTQIYTHPNQDDLKNAIQSLDRNHSNNDVTEARSTRTADIANGTDTTNANRDMR